jgi:hypothetical protein
MTYRNAAKKKNKNKNKNKKGRFEFIRGAGAWWGEG